MFCRPVISRKILHSIIAIWFSLFLAGVVWVLVIGNRQGLEMVLQITWVHENRDLVRDLWDNNYFLLPLYAIFLALLFYAWYTRSKRCLAVVASYLAAQLICNVLVVRPLKMLTGEARPRTLSGTDIDSLWIGPTMDHNYHSFPSGHASDVFISAFFLALLLPRPWMRAAIFAYATFNALTRLAVARHFPVDIITGMFLGGLTALLTVKYLLIPYLSAQQPEALETSGKSSS